ncbi:MAG: phosphoglycerate dehydrogenase [Clostridium sp.]|jgi:D-3-phosphoglycerate dehydrogenase|uniref:phosphoglycerate dehydrogenase n=1 Tax=Clostridium sp. TaxID=1506 RepID=UPI0025C20FEE|nr:phosphoglycerate dehydrogenase [Clostridium sp.]MCH3965105.1 phosphoglycerate dehydrogenase [Clostridium sp.]MCI1714326.1 phosphoglycerate dehydrogenase [Clostridium sp.]MCI1798588.1 phosphoglycerate dehydrogenase [Clostridium sp.]MCI1812681.1 phosphoglycerate dehydrogenase [Clostridium sp.]MCI1869397.1 phosphoglycerate dehydrogenase [Clostridium sp.]
MKNEWKVVATAVSFGKFYKQPVERLEKAGCKVILNPFGRPFTKAEMIEYASDADALIVGNDKVPGDVIDHFTKMKVIAKHGVGVDAIDKEKAHDMGIIVTNAPGTNKEEVADCAMGFILMIARDYYRAIRETKNKEWIKRPGISLYKKTIGIIGIGNIGLATVKRATGFSMRILGYDIVERDAAKTLGVEYVDLPELLSQSDFISLHVPLNEGTYKILSKNQFDMMKKGAILVNTARSKCIDSNALMNALKDGKLLGYATDVYDSEPPEWQPYFDFPNVLMTPHEAGTTYDSNRRMGSTAVDNVLSVKSGKVPPNLIAWEEN